MLSSSCCAARIDGAVVPNRLATWQKRLHEHRADRFACVAPDQDQVVGFICAFGNEDKSWGFYIDNLYIDLDYQHCGIGTELMCRTGRWLGEHYTNLGVYLWVMEANLSARTFYERIGARNRETVMKSDPGGGRAPNCRYTWKNPALFARRLAPWTWRENRAQLVSCIFSPVEPAWGNDARICMHLPLGAGRAQHHPPTLTNEILMQYVLIIHAVKDYSAWKKFFDEAASIRRAAGEVSYQLLRYEGDSNKIVHFSKWQSIAHAKAFFESPAVVEIRQKAGVEAPEFIYLHALEDGVL